MRFSGLRSMGVLPPHSRFLSHISWGRSGIGGQGSGWKARATMERKIECFSGGRFDGDDLFEGVEVEVSVGDGGCGVAIITERSATEFLKLSASLQDNNDAIFSHAVNSVFNQDG